MEHHCRNIGPMIVAVEMGYGHLRPAYALAELFGTEVVRMDIPPMAGPVESCLWKTARTLYHGLSRACDWPATGNAARLLLENITEIAPLKNHSSRQAANLASYLADGLAATFMGRRFRSMASGAGSSIVATYPVAALAARRARCTRVFCLATDTDLNRAWAPPDAERAEIEYLAPVEQVAKRLRSFGVPDQRIHLTGFPLPTNLVGQAMPSLARRLRRLDPNSIFRNQTHQGINEFYNLPEVHFSMQPVSMTVAIGGAGAQTGQVGQVLISLKRLVLEGRLNLTLVAGIRPDVAAILRQKVQSAGLASCMDKEIKILLAKNLNDYFRLFNACLVDTDVLWTKPSELVFYAALGLPILLAAPVGGQEHANRNWLLSKNAALDACDPTTLDRRFENWLASGDLCRIAWNGYSNFERNGADRILSIIENE